MQSPKVTQSPTFKKCAALSGTISPCMAESCSPTGTISVSTPRSWFKDFFQLTSFILLACCILWAGYYSVNLTLATSQRISFNEARAQLPPLIKNSKLNPVASSLSLHVEQENIVNFVEHSFSKSTTQQTVKDSIPILDEVIRIRLPDAHAFEKIANHSNSQSNVLENYQAVSLFKENQTSVETLNILSVSPLDDVVRKLLPKVEAAEYIKLHPGHSFRFYVYEDLHTKYTWQHVSRCIEGIYGKKQSCDWGSSICTVKKGTIGKYIKRRFNRNGDVVLASIFDRYNGTLRTRNPNEADLFIVPYPSAGNCECRGAAYDRLFPVRCGKDIPQDEIRNELLHKLKYFDATTKDKHLFLSSNVYSDAHACFRQKKFISLVTTLGAHKCVKGENCGHIVMPYVNTNPEYQPNAVIANHLPDVTDRQIALSAFMSGKISGNGYDRRSFLSTMQNVTEIAGRRVHISTLEDRTITGDLEEESILRVYRNSIFCPCLRGDQPPQKRIFDVLMSGCIPVVVVHNPSQELDWPSHFSPMGPSIRQTYPFSKGNFFNHSNMGIDFRDLLIALPGDCGMTCLLPTLTDLLVNNLGKIREIQRKIAFYSSLFTFGMEENGLKYADAVSSLLVHARHYLILNKNSTDQREHRINDNKLQNVSTQT